MSQPIYIEPIHQQRLLVRDGKQISDETILTAITTRQIMYLNNDIVGDTNCKSNNNNVLLFVICRYIQSIVVQYENVIYTT